VHAKFPQRLPHALSSNAPTDREYFDGKRKYFVAYIACEKSWPETSHYIASTGSCVVNWNRSFRRPLCHSK
jgi:hypothetical protein